MHSSRKKRGILFILSGLGLAAGLTACDSSSNVDEDSAQSTTDRTPVVVTDKGRLQGISDANMREYRGIAYAAPPVGDLRWKPPQPSTAWSGVRQADHFAPHCPQKPSPFGTPSVSEDCLYLNVYTPKDDQTHPVMVWIHGGAFIDGESDDYNPAPLVARGIVVVTINYRLGILGFLAHPALTAASPDNSSGDYGLMDQQAALRWVERSIAAFGGDPDKVTIFGVSAGGLSVISQMVSPTAKGLFDRAIVESGSYSLALPSQPTLASAEKQGRLFADKAGCTNQALKCLRALSVDAILANQGAAPTRFIPNTETPVLPQPITSALASGDFNQVPLIEGTNRNEWRLFVALAHDLTPEGPLEKANYLPALKQTFMLPEQAAQAVAAQYPLDQYENADLALAAAGTDGAFACPGLTEIGLISQHVPVYAYEFADSNAPELFLPPVDSFDYKATHSSEIQYFLNFFSGANLVRKSTFSTDQKRLSQDMVTYWSQFARTGNPNPSSGVPPFWPEYKAGKGAYLSLLAPTPKTLAAFGQEHNCDFWAQALSP